ncbi:MAG: tyrosine-type recombinase/integrase [Flavobacteriaceae bacterium]|nr:MAG: tyrosine-type recombinase/integrase [Flavobacteriaceae bacterium]
MSISHFLTYLDCERKYSPYTITAYRKDLISFKEFCEKEFQINEISEVSYSLIRSWIVSLVEGGISNRSINRKVSSLRSYFNYLMKSKQIEDHPLRKHQSLKVEKRVNLPFSEKEINEVLDFFEHAEDFEQVRDKLIIELLYTTGMRRAELIGLKVGSIDLSQNLVKVVGKRNKERQLPLLNSVANTIKKYRLLREGLEVKSDSFFLTKKGEEIYPTLVYRIVNNYFGRVSVKVKKSPHIVRHSFATLLLSEGADLNSVKELLGHSSLASTQVYTHSNLKDLKMMYNRAHPRSNKNY